MTDSDTFKDLLGDFRMFWFSLGIDTKNWNLKQKLRILFENLIFVSVPAQPAPTKAGVFGMTRMMAPKLLILSDNSYENIISIFIVLKNIWVTFWILLRVMPLITDKISWLSGLFRDFNSCATTENKLGLTAKMTMSHVSKIKPVDRNDYKW